ncbi:hypothetical protein E3N88_01794 [Mikania micrantha]|uniref:Uncharacterized protein n=1 Tax=Mikania micrantha TaxID=192012 RepID=A0A5N6Q4A4_9ASTR|nr:hypothetical protein E3N88_01794 [Mikania micrantha]
MNRMSNPNSDYLQLFISHGSSIALVFLHRHCRLPMDHPGTYSSSDRSLPSSGPKLARRSTSVHGPKSCTRDSCAGAGSLWLLRLRGRPLAARRGGRVSCGAVGLRRRRREGLKVGKGAVGRRQDLGGGKGKKSSLLGVFFGLLLRVTFIMNFRTRALLYLIYFQNGLKLYHYGPFQQ